MKFSARFEAALLERAEHLPAVLHLGAEGFQAAREHSAADLQAAAPRWVGAAFPAAAHNGVDLPVAEAAVVAGVAAAERPLT